MIRKHKKKIDWTGIFDLLNHCVLCGRICETGTAKAEHMRKHCRGGQAVETGIGFAIFK